MKSIQEITPVNFESIIENTFNQLEESRDQFSNTSVFEIISVLEKVGKLWAKNSEYYLLAKKFLNEENQFSEQMNEKSLDIISDLLDKNNLIDRVVSEIKNIKCLDGFEQIDKYSGKLYYAPLGVLLHVTAGNVFLGCIDSIILGALTKNQSIIKLSSQNKYLPDLFYQTILAADENNILRDNVKLMVWKGGQACIEKGFKARVDGIIAWGGEEMVKNYAKDLPLETKLIQHGPKISFHVISKAFFDKAENKILESIAVDIALWDQSACANSQNIFLEKEIDANDFSKKLYSAFNRLNIDRGNINSDEFVELIKDEQEGLYQEFLTGNEAFVGKDFQIQYDNELLNPTALNRSIKIKHFDTVASLSKMLGAFQYYLQSCGLCVSSKERSVFTKKLSLAGVNRFCSAGSMLSSLAGSPHDGSFPINELTKVCTDESVETFDDFINETDAPYYKDLKYKKFIDLPLIDGELLGKHSIVKDAAFLSPSANEGYIYSSGGTTGEPKFCFYSYDEFKLVTKLLGQSYIGLGIKPGDRVANLFMAGNMWSSFNAIQEALQYTQALQFPMGGLIEPNDFKKYITQFDIKILFGLPSLLIEMANVVKNINIEKIFYAGEGFTKESELFIKSVWGNPEIISAGYASVDVGPIGYQTPECVEGEHYLFSDLIRLEVVDEEAVVTSKIRKMMPVIRYKTGDRVEILENINGKIKFKLLGRVDKKINIWSTRFEVKEVKNILKDFLYDGKFQIIIDKSDNDNQYSESLKIVLRESNSIELKEFIDKFHSDLADVYNTHSRGYLDGKISLIIGEFLVNEKTGKFKEIIDLR